jgi:type VI protein secretion system component Hcp
MVTVGKAIRTILGGGILASAALVTPSAGAASYQMSINIPGAGVGSYTLRGFSWGDSTSSFIRGASSEVVFTRMADKNSAAFAQLAKSRAQLPTADLTVNVPAPGGQVTTVQRFQMTNVVVQGIRESGSAASSDSQPDESITLRFHTLTYTYQPVNADGTKAGPPTSVTFDFKDVRDRP